MKISRATTTTTSTFSSTLSTSSTSSCRAVRLLFVLPMLSVVLGSVTADVRPLHVRMALERVMDGPGMENLDQDQKQFLVRLLAAIDSSADETNELNHSEDGSLPEVLVARALRAAAAPGAAGGAQLPLGNRERKAGCKNFFWKTFSSC
ncbi:somatostatin-1-like [Lampetra fluviatilis]|uniref:Somatostatin b n=1 Tax=Lampetra fluviatilis TaxID=7748 RepID=A0A1B3IKD4_LAMFL|nr:somatostatin b [Lampetra fluviatilis]